MKTATIRIVCLIVILSLLITYWINNPHMFVGLIVFMLIVYAYDKMKKKYSMKRRAKKLRTKSIIDLPNYKKGDQFVYIIKDLDITGFYKIGRTKNLRQRMDLFSVKLPINFEITHIILTKNCVETESFLHKQYASKRRNGEWFELNNNDIKHLKSMERM